MFKEMGFYGGCGSGKDCGGVGFIFGLGGWVCFWDFGMFLRWGEGRRWYLDVFVWKEDCDEGLGILL